MATHFHIDNAAFRWLLGGRVEVKEVSYYKLAGPFENNPLGWILHVQDGDGSPWAYFNSRPPGERKFSHLWVSKTGRIEQYASLSYKSWAQVDGNSTYWSIETEGLPSEKLTGAQLDSLALIHYALEVMLDHNLNHIANAPGQPGIGTHSMGGAAWGGHACPGPIRAAQRPEILTIAEQLHVH